MPFPVPAVRLAPTNNPFDVGPTWTVVDGNKAGADLTPRLIKCRLNQERQHSLAQFERAQWTGVFNNDDRRFDPFFTSGPYTTNLKPRRPINWRMTHNSVTYDMFTGFIRSVRPGWNGPKERTATIVAEDAFSVFQRTRLRLGRWAAWIPKYNPRAWYRMNEPDGATVMKDSAPTAHDGSYTGTAKVTGTPGFIDSDGADNRCLFTGASLRAAAGPVDAGLDNVTETPAWAGIGAFIRVVSLPASGQSYTLYSQIVDGGSAQFAVRILDNGKIRLNSYTDVFDSSGSIVAGADYFITVLHLGSTVQIGIDDTFTILVTSPVTYNKAAPHWGEHPDGTREYNGYIDEAVTWVGSMPTQADITALALDRRYTHTVSGQDDPLLRISALMQHINFIPVSIPVTGTNTVQFAEAMDTTYLEYMQALIATEGGLMYVRGDGTLVLAPQQPAAAPSSTVTFGPGASEIHYRSAPEPEYTDDSQLLINQVTLTSSVWPDVEASDSGSITVYGPSGPSLRTLFKDRAGMTTRAGNIIARYKDPRKRIPSVTLNSSDNLDNQNLAMAALLGTPLGVGITAKTPDGDAVVSQVMGRSFDLDMSQPEIQATYTLEPW